MKNRILRGIVVAGNSRAEAEAYYRAVATGASVKALQDEEAGNIILTNANSVAKLSDPVSGADRLTVVASAAVDKMGLKFLSESSGRVATFYTVCSDGCESHLIADDKDVMVHCPVCTASLQELDDETLASFSKNPESTEDASAVTASSDDSTAAKTVEFIAVAGSIEDAISKYRDLMSRSSGVNAFDCEQGIVVANADTEFKFSPFTGEAATNVDVPEFSAEASDSGEFDAMVFSCASSACGTHVVSSSENPVFCPCCASGLTEPEDEEDYDEEEEEDLDLEDEEEEEEDEDYDAEAGVEEDEEEEEEEDEDSDDDSDDESEEEEEEDMDDENSLSVSSAATADADAIAAAAKLAADNAGAGTTADTTGAAAALAGTDTAVQATADTTGTAVVDPVQTDEAALAAAALAASSQEDTTGAAAKTEEEVAAAALASQEADKLAAQANADEPKVVEVIKEVPVAQKAIETNMLALASTGAELSADNLYVSYAGNVNGSSKWIAFNQDTPIATASSVNTKHTDIFPTPAFGNVVLASAKEEGVGKALSDFGFEPIVASVAVDVYVQENIDAQVTAQVAEAQASLDTVRNDYEQRFGAALATAAAGINSGFFHDAKNPVKECLSATLQSLGIQNADALIQTAFASGNNEYHANLLNKTNHIMKYDLDVQNQLTEAVASVSESSAGVSIGKPAVKQKPVVEPVNENQVSLSSSTSTAPNAKLKSALGSLGQKQRRY